MENTVFTITKVFLKKYVCQCKLIFTLANDFTPYIAGQRKIAFTLAEVLITLGIIGVVAAMTLPSLINNYQKSVATVKLKRVWATLMNATQYAENDYGPSENWEYPTTGTNHSSDITTSEFFNRYYVPYMKTSKIISRVKYKVYNLNKSDSSFDNSSRGNSFRLNDGMCITMWANNQFFVFTADLNCEKPPNVIGKDVFDVAELYWIGNKNLAVPFLDDLKKGKKTRADCIASCKSHTYVGGIPSTCFALFVYDGWQFKDDYPQ